MNSVCGGIWPIVMVVACTASPKPVEPQQRDGKPPTMRVDPRTHTPSSSTVSSAKKTGSPPRSAESELEVELLLEDVEGAWLVGDRVLAQTLVTQEQGGMRRELYSVDGGSMVPLGRLNGALSLGEFVRVERVYGTWSEALWIELHADLVSEKRVELHRFEAQGELPRKVGQWVGSMQSHLAAAEQPDGWVFLFHDPLTVDRKGTLGFAGSPPLPTVSGLSKADPHCEIPYELCGLRSGQAGILKLLAIRCEHTPLTVSWSERRAQPTERFWPRSHSPLRCEEHPDWAEESTPSEAGIEATRLLARLRDEAQVRITTPAGPLAAPAEEAYLLGGRTLLLAGRRLYRERAKPAPSAATLGSPVE